MYVSDCWVQKIYGLCWVLQVYRTFQTAHLDEIRGLKVGN